ncbi:hypothetical protein GILI108418_11265 [Gillisia limnaea]|uniref:Uncharacterized protein n=1 Tax=Gillisia limnaea (strain DSM 15749 / LMG 21470 / R-8282) TaxID=865937 RepID=H2BVY8_GILLR|nr:hypothetical protein Gilli_1200 [Gillisia limnaea DSM 15749]
MKIKIRIPIIIGLIGPQNFKKNFSLVFLNLYTLLIPNFAPGMERLLELSRFFLSGSDPREPAVSRPDQMGRPFGKTGRSTQFKKTLKQYAIHSNFIHLPLIDTRVI